MQVFFLCTMIHIRIGLRQCKIKLFSTIGLVPTKTPVTNPYGICQSNFLLIVVKEKKKKKTFSLKIVYAVKVLVAHLLLFFMASIVARTPSTLPILRTKAQPLFPPITPWWVGWIPTRSLTMTLPTYVKVSRKIRMQKQEWGVEVDFEVVVTSQRRWDTHKDPGAKQLASTIQLKEHSSTTSHGGKRSKKK